MQLSIRHDTRFAYDDPADYALVQLRVRPVSGPAQTVERWEVELDGAHRHAAFTDAYGTRVELIELSPEARAVTIRVSGEVSTHPQAGIMGPDAPLRNAVRDGTEEGGRLPLWH
ncbi:MAG: transglutaminase N-terminal domain-containing protein, partial [Litorimonas sp.]